MIAYLERKVVLKLLSENKGKLVHVKHPNSNKKYAYYLPQSMVNRLNSETKEYMVMIRSTDKELIAATMAVESVPISEIIRFNSIAVILAIVDLEDYSSFVMSLPK